MLLVPFLSFVYILGVTFNSMAGFLFGFNEQYTTSSLIKEANYPVETHTVKTEDGYILTMHRIPYGKNSSLATKGPVFLMHGIACSSADWIVSGSKSLGFSLADAGFDVWMGNNRGNTYSLNHLNSDEDHKAFFEFSYDEIGRYDLPAMIDYVLEETKMDKLRYVGFSEGVTTFLVMMNYRPEYNGKISTAIAWAPVTDAYQIKSKIINSLADSRILGWIAEHSNWYELWAYRQVGNSFRALCRTMDWACTWLFSLLGSSDEYMPNKDFKGKILYNYPAGMSLKQLLHYVQGARTGVFRPYVYSTEDENIKIYHKVVPDPYNLSAVTVSMTLYYAESDIYGNSERLLNNVVKQLKNASAILVPMSNFNHIDFIWNTNNDWLIAETITKLEAAPNENETTILSSTATTGGGTENSTEASETTSSATATTAAPNENETTSLSSTATTGGGTEHSTEASETTSSATATTAAKP